MSEATPVVEAAPRADVEALQRHRADAVMSVGSVGDYPCVRVTRDSIVSVLEFLRTDPDCRYQFFGECVGIDYLRTATGDLVDGHTDRFDVVYNLAAVSTDQGSASVRRLFVRVGVPADDPRVASATGVYPGAGFPEREIYDMFGITFDGHPDMRRILMPDDWVGHPQRKDYPLGGERVQFTEAGTGPAVSEPVVQHPGESFDGKTGSELGDVD